MNIFKLCVCTLAVVAIGCTPPKGEIGPKGSTGLPGANGTNGTNGPVGDKGATGATGATGETGVAGAKGPEGQLLAFYSDWKPLTFKLDSEQTFAGVLTAQYSADFEEATLTEAVLSKGTVMIFMERKAKTGTRQIDILKSTVQSTYTFLDASGKYGIRGTLNEVGKVKFTINAESSSANAQSVLQKINNEKINIQTYAVTASN